MARVLEVSPPKFAQAWLNSFDQRTRGDLGSLEQTIGHIATALGGRPSSANITRAARIRLRFARGLLESAGPTLPALDELRAAGTRLALISDTSDDTVRLWSGAPLSLRFEVVVFSSAERVRKPDPRIYQIGLDRLKLPPSRCAYVGDGGSHELTGAEAMGLTVFQYLFPGEDESTAFRLEQDTEWKGTRLTDLRELLTSDQSRASGAVR
jgi:putative hydrolase of the HAD superfamily